MISRLAWQSAALGAAAVVGSSHAHCALFGDKKKRKRIAIYGGAFDPPTNGHLTACAEIINSELADAVWLCPCGPRPDKPNMKTPAVDRYVMCELAVNSALSAHFPVVVKDTETFRGAAMYTYDLLSSLRKAHPDCDFCFVIGSDWLQPGTDLREWTSSVDSADPTCTEVVVTGDKLVTEFDFIVVRRPGYDVPRDGLAAFGPRFRWLTPAHDFVFIEPGNVSSTELRKRLAHETRAVGAARSLQSIDGLAPPAVIAYIRRRGLYC